MYISNLTLHGFKSFGQRTALNFGDGITGVVGPNGCGKTNIVDALRWVLGEQKQSVLRSSRMEEIIFHGSRTRKAANFSEVTLSIHNDRSILPLEYTDIEISRRLYRDGESEYLINGNPCRLKDITDLFLDTGMGSDAYSVIELNMIEAILSDVEDDRRRMFEEAAGINKYKLQRAAAQRKLDATSLDMERVNDIIGEVEGQVKSLGLQLKRYERHHRLSVDLKTRELALAGLQLGVLAKALAPLESHLSEGRDAHESETSVIVREEAQLEKFQATLREREEDRERSRLQLAEATEALTVAKEQLLVWKEQVRSSRSSLERFESERGAELERIGALEADGATLDRQLLGLAPELERDQAAFDAKRPAEASVTDAYQQGERKLQAAQEAVFDHRQQLQAMEARRERSMKSLQEQQRQSAGVHQASADREQELASHEERIGAARIELEGVGAQQAALVKTQTRVEASLQELRGRDAQLMERQHQSAAQIKVLTSRLEIFTQLVESFEGYPGGTRALLAERGQFPGLLGTVAGLAQVRPEHALAFELALGPFATCLITQTAGQAEALLAYASERQLARLSVIPLDRLKGGASPAISAPAPNVTPLASLITAPQELRGLYDLLLEGYFWQPGDELPGGYLPAGAVVMNAAGHLAGPVPIWTHLEGAAGEPASMTASIMGRASEIERIRLALDEAGTTADAIREQQLTATEERETAEGERARVARELEALKGAADRLSKAVSQTEFEQQRARGDLGQLERQAGEFATAIAGLEQSLTEENDRVAQFAGRAARLEQAVGEARRAYEEVRARRDAWQGELQELRLRLLQQENLREKLAARKLSLEDNLAASTQRVAGLDKEIEQATRSSEDLAQKISLGAAELSAHERVVEGRRQAEEKVAAAVRLVRGDVSRLEEQIRQRQHGQEATLSQHQDVERELADLRKEEALIHARIRELFNAAVVPREHEQGEADEGVLQVEIGKLRAALERIGPINMAVADEYKEEAKRFTFLSEQRDDLVASETSLDETVRRMDQQARDQFRNTFDQIRHHFKQTFTLFFEGGQGDLKLVGDSDPLLAGIEIVAQPPGKKTRSLRALSGGEKALTAIALLFATYLVKPSPFCVLDEVDAPLDDVNIKKFTRVIRQFARDTQFIIVTHNKLTMQSVDFLYGVTMAEEGLSTLVSVSLEEYAH